ncbi:expressed protein [Phakopsora pachyrhizi]|uniref:Expressed protein n=1 Tax=Phakopsora pachyrhizi TaxID=170000 RepID=A0AAV0AS93_PHAPC|nr:expressed protein [Phakopsora pachyrhizi]
MAFIGDFFTPMLPLLLFFYAHSTILCSTTLLLFLVILYPLLFCSFILVLSLSCSSPLNPFLISFLFFSFLFTWGGLYYTLYV